MKNFFDKRAQKVMVWPGQPYVFTWRTYGFKLDFCLTTTFVKVTHNL